MSSVLLIDAQSRFRDLGLRFIDIEGVQGLFGVGNRNTLIKMLSRWEKNKILSRIRRGEYQVEGMGVGNYEIANRLVYPSYVSLETALSFYGILPQFGYSITSVTTQKSANRRKGNMDFEYIHINPQLYWGYEKQGEYLIANKEKAIVDTLYLVAKGLRTTHPEEWDISGVDKSKLQEYATRIKFNPFVKLFSRCNLV